MGGCQTKQPQSETHTVITARVAVPRVMTYEEAANGCVPFPFRRNHHGKSFPNGLQWRFFTEREPERGDDQFAYLEKKEAHEKKLADVSESTFCDTFETAFPTYDASSGSFEVALTQRCMWYNERFTSGGSELQPETRLHISGERESFVKSFAVSRPVAEAMDAKKRKLFRPGEKSNWCDDDRYQIPVHVVYKARPRSEWLTGKNDGTPTPDATVDVIAWEVPEFEALVQSVSGSKGSLR